MYFREELETYNLGGMCSLPKGKETWGHGDIPGVVQRERFL